MDADDPPRPFFRPEVTRARREQWLGTVLLVAPIRRWLLAALSFTLGVFVIAFLCLAHYTRRETISGTLVPDVGLMNVVARAQGKVAAVHVVVGQHVNVNDNLLEISSEHDTAVLGSTGSRVADELESQRAGFASDLANQRRLSALRIAALDDRLHALHAQATDLDAEIEVQQRLVKGNEEMMEKFRQLSTQGFVSAVQVQQRDTTLLDSQSHLRELDRQRSALQQDIDTALNDRSQIPMQTLTERNEIQRHMADVEQAIARNETERGTILRAPHAGVVSALLTQAGQSVTTNQSLLTILPDGATLVARLFVPSRSIGFIEPRRRVVLRYQAFPYQKFGLQYGRVTEISRSALSPSEVRTIADLQTDEPMYTLQIGLNNQFIVVDGQNERLMPGMAVDVDIPIERRRIYEWIFEPMIGAVDRSSGIPNA